MIITKTPLRISFVGGGTDNLLKQDFDEMKGNLEKLENRMLTVENNA